MDDGNQEYFYEAFLNEILDMTDFNNQEALSVLMKHKKLSEMKNLVGETLLHYAVRDGNVDIIKFSIESGVEVNAQCNSGKTPLMLAINSNSTNLQIFELLLEAGANVDIEDSNGKTILQLILCDEDYIGTPVQKLFLDVIQRRSNNDSRLVADKLISLGCSLWTAVLSRNAEIIEHMILSGQQIDSCQPRTGMTALHMAVSEMDLKIIEVLIKHGANVDLQDRKGLLPIAYYGLNNPDGVQQPEIIRILLDRSTILKDFGQNKGITQLKLAFHCGTRQVIRMLIENFSDIFDFKDRQGQTLLHYIVANCHSDVTEELRGLTIDVNVRDNSGSTPLLNAARYYNSHTNTFRFLLESGADVNASNEYSYVPLFGLCSNLLISEEQYAEIIEMFIQHGVNVSYAEPSRNLTAFDFIGEISERSRKFNMAQPLLAQLAIQNNQGHPVEKYIQDKIDSDQTFKTCFDDCKRQLAQIKAHVTSNEQRLTCYRFLVTPEEKIAKICRYMDDWPSHLDYLKSECSFDHEYYNTMIKKRIDKVVEKIKLYQEAALVICRILKLGRNINHIVVIEILDYLSFLDLENLLKSDL